MKNRIIAVLLCLTLIVSVSSTALAVSEQDAAAKYLVDHRIISGDEKGNLNLDKSLTRAELAALLPRLDGAAQLWETQSQEGNDFRYSVASYYTNNCKYTDVPNWALLYISYCRSKGLMNGYGETKFGSHDPVNPTAICMVTLRWLGYPETDWGYDSAVAKAKAVGIIPESGFSGDTVLRGEVAVVLYNAMTLKSEADSIVTLPAETPGTPAKPNGQPTDAELYEMAVDVVRLVNIERAKEGLRELVLKPELMDVAKWKSQDMADSRYFGHFSPNLSDISGQNLGGGQTGQKIRELNIRGLFGCAENITMGVTTTAQEAMNKWMNSSAHRENVLDSDQTHIGVGVACRTEHGSTLYYWTQTFCVWTDEEVDADRSRNLPYIGATNPATAYTPLKTK